MNVYASIGTINAGLNSMIVSAGDGNNIGTDIITIGVAQNVIRKTYRISSGTSGLTYYTKPFGDGTERFDIAILIPAWYFVSTLSMLHETKISIIDNIDGYTQLSFTT